MRDDTDRPRDGQDPSARGRLRLIHPAPPKREKSKHGRRPPIFSPDEEARFRAALKNARVLFGSWECLADAMYMRKSTLWHAAGGMRPISPEIAVRLARALGVPLESLYGAPVRVVGKCPTCGGSTRRP